MAGSMRRATLATLMLTALVVATLGAPGGTHVHAADAPGVGAPYYRFWHGLKLANTTYNAWLSEINKFIVATVDVGRGIALIGYVPVLTSPAGTSGDDKLYTETALVVYSSEAAYHKLMSSPAGVAYQHSHWGLFSEEHSSSAVPVPYVQGNVTIGGAVDVLGSPAMWGSGVAFQRVYMRATSVPDTLYSTSVDSYAATMKSFAGDTGGLMSLVVRVDADATYVYELWSSAGARAVAMATSHGQYATQKLVAFTNLETDARPRQCETADGKTPGAINITWSHGLNFVLPSEPPM